MSIIFTSLLSILFLSPISATYPTPPPQIHDFLFITVNCHLCVYVYMLIHKCLNLLFSIAHNYMCLGLTVPTDKSGSLRSSRTFLFAPGRNYDRDPQLVNTKNMWPWDVQPQLVYLQCNPCTKSSGIIIGDGGKVVKSQRTRSLLWVVPSSSDSEARPVKSQMVMMTGPANMPTRFHL